MEGLNAFDAAVMGFVQANFHTQITDAVFPIITYLGEAGIVWIALSLVLLFTKKCRLCGVLMLCAMLGAFLTGEVLIENIVCRPRPCQQFPEYVAMLIPPPGSYSFPSGHSSSSFAAATVLFGFSKKWGVSAFVLAFLIALSRVFLFVHYPTDVLAGVALGILFGLLTLFVYRHAVRPKLNKKADV